VAEVLVLIQTVDAVGGQITKPALELLTIAGKIGEPSAVVFGPANADILSEYGAQKIYVFDAQDFAAYLVAPKAEAVAKLVSDKAPAALLVTATAEGKDRRAGRVEDPIGYLYDTVGVTPADAGIQTVQWVFAGNYTVTAAVTQGTPIIAVKPNAVVPQPAANGAPPLVEVVPFTVSNAAKGAKITSSQEKGAATTSPELSQAAIVVSGGRGTGGDFSEVEATSSAARLARPGQRWTPGGIRTVCRSVRPVQLSRRRRYSRRIVGWRTATTADITWSLKTPKLVFFRMASYSVR
jgi:electron transfer flavoprotein alpha subunit